MRCSSGFRRSSPAGGVALLEIGSDQEEAVLAAARAAFPEWAARVEPDLSGRPRVLRLEAAPPSPASGGKG